MDGNKDDELVWVICDSNDSNAQQIQWTDDKCVSPVITFDDILSVMNLYSNFQIQNPKFETFNKQFGDWPVC